MTIVLSVVPNHTEYPLLKGKMPAEDLAGSTFATTSWDMQGPSVLKRSNGKAEEILWYNANPEHKKPTRGTEHTPPLPTLWVHNPLPMLDAQIAAESKHPLPQTVCRWIVALL